MVTATRRTPARAENSRAKAAALAETQAVSVTLRRDTDVRSAIESGLVIAAHDGQGVSLPAKWPEQEFSDYWKSECGECHSQQFEIWKNSKHFRAYGTLVSKARHRDSQCIGCHVQEVAAVSGTPKVLPSHAGVTCKTCHQKSGEVSQLFPARCVQCHTSDTDPDSRFQTLRMTACASGATTEGTLDCRLQGAREE